MTHSRSRRRRAHRMLRSETPSTVAVLATERDFAAMRGYRTFTFRDYPDYLRHVHRLLRALNAQGVHTRVAQFDPHRFVAYCIEDGLDPDAPVSRTSYTADLAGAGFTVPYQGQSCDELLPLLRAHRTRDAAFHAAAHALEALLTALGPGTHHIVCSIDGPQQPLLAVLHVEAESDGTWELAESDVLLFCSVLGSGLATASPGGLVTRTTPRRPEKESRPYTPETVRGWCLHDGWLAPLTEGEVFSAYCTHAETGEPVPPEPGVDYGAGIFLPRPARAGD